MEDMKKRKLEEIGNGELVPSLNDTVSSSTVEELRSLLDPLAKPQLVDPLARAGMQLKEAQQMLLDVQMRLLERLEIQKKLQLRFEEQCKQLKMMIDQQQKTTWNLVGSTNPSSKSILSPAIEEDVEVMASKGSDDDMVFPST